MKDVDLDQPIELTGAFDEDEFWALHKICVKASIAYCGLVSLWLMILAAASIYSFYSAMVLLTCEV